MLTPVLILNMLRLVRLLRSSHANNNNSNNDINDIIINNNNKKTEAEKRRRYGCFAPRLAGEFVHLHNDVILRAVLPLNCDPLVCGPRDGAQVVISTFTKKKNKEEKFRGSTRRQGFIANHAF